MTLLYQPCGSEIMHSVDCRICLFVITFMLEPLPVHGWVSVIMDHLMMPLWGAEVVIWLLVECELIRRVQK